MVTIYNSKYLQPDAGALELQNKVQFDIRFYMMRRGSENIDKMTKNTFKLEYDTEIGMAYVRKVQDEVTKNHQETDSEIITGFMPQILDATTGVPHKLCPVRSFENYLCHLNPEQISLWQVPLKKVDTNNPDVWYSKLKQGHCTLDKFMKTLSENLSLSQYYTNHCIRVTGVTNLTRTQFSAKQIMSISGHKSLESLAIYQKVANDEKMMMGMSLTYSLLHPHNIQRVVPKTPNAAIAPTNILPALPSVPVPLQTAAVATVSSVDTSKIAITPDEQKKSENASDLSSALLPTGPDSDFNLSEILTEFEQMNDDNDLLIQATQQAECNNMLQTSSTSLIRRNPPQMPSFSNCKIGNININIYKQ